MGTPDKKISQYHNMLTDILAYTDIDEHLLESLHQFIEAEDPSSNYATVACSKKVELLDIHQTFLLDFLKMEDDQSLMISIKEVCSDLGSANRTKYRAVFYYHLLFKLDQTANFLDKIDHSGDPSQEDHRQQKKTIKKYARYAAMIGFIPVPLVDIAGISTIQYKMIKELSEQFPQIDKTDKGDHVIASLIGGLVSFELGLITRTLFKSIPLIGSVLSGTAVSIYAYFSTKIIGEIFEEHFQSGGDLTIDTITLNKMKAQYRNSINNINLSSAQ